MPTCPHCGQPVRPGHALCPFCGTNLATGETPERTPATLEGTGPGITVGCGLLLVLFVFLIAYTIIGRDFWIMHHWHGAKHRPPPAYFIWVPYAVPVTMIVVLVVALRRRAPMFVRGLLISLSIAVALWLGALVVCH